MAICTCWQIHSISFKDIWTVRFEVTNPPERDSLSSSCSARLLFCPDSCQLTEQYLMLLKLSSACRARAAAPAVIFFDELDGLAANRSDAGARQQGGTGIGERVLSQLLIEMDGLQASSEKSHLCVAAVTCALRLVPFSDRLKSFECG